MSSVGYYSSAKVKELEATTDDGQIKTLKNEEIVSNGFPEAEIEMEGEDYYPQISFSYSREKTTLKRANYSIAYERYSYTALKAKKFNLEDIWVAGINAPYSDLFQGVYLDENIAAETYLITKIDNKTNKVIDEYRIDSVPGIIHDVKEYEKEHKLDGEGRKIIKDYDLLVDLIKLDYRFYELASDELKVNKNIKEITIPSNVTSIGKCAFRNCESLINITIPETIKYIGDNAFYSCSSLTSVTIPSSVKHIERDAFEGCSSLTEIIANDEIKEKIITGRVKHVRI